MWPLVRTWSVCSGCVRSPGMVRDIIGRMKEIDTVPAAVPEKITADESDKKAAGYTLEDLRYRRALAALQKEFAKEKMLHGLNRIKKYNVLTGNPSNAKIGSLAKAGTLASRLLGGLNYLDYVMIGFSLFGTVRKAFRLFGKKK